MNFILNFIRQSIESSKVRYGLAGLFIGLIAYTMIVHGLIIMDPRPIEYREGAQLHLVNELQNGVNIYDFSNKPYDTDVYGIAYHKVASLVTPSWASSYQPQRILTAFFIVGACVVILLMFRENSLDIKIGFVVACVWYAHYPRMWGICGRPDAMATLFYFFSVFLPWKYRFSRTTLTISAACAVVAFFTKPYFAAGVVFVFIYLVYRKRMWDAVFHASIFGCIFLASVVLAHLSGSAYFYDTIFVNLGYGSGSNWKWLTGQIVRFIGLNLPLVACMFVAGWIGLKKWGAGSHTLPANGRVLSGLDFNYLIVAGVVATLVLLKIAQNKGSHEYFIHLLSPVLLVAGYKFLSSRRHITLALAAGVTQAAVLAPPFPDYHQNEWNDVKTIVAGNRRVLNSPTTVHLALSRGETVFDSGQTEYFHKGLEKGAKFYPQAVEAWGGFQEDLRGRVEKREFSLILLNAGMPSIIDRDILWLDYYMSGTMPAPLHRQRNNVLELWQPIKPQP